MLTLFLMISVTDYATAQCCSQSTCSSHQDSEVMSSGHTQHEGSKQASKSKEYASIKKDGKQEATITIKEGYHSDTIVVKKGVPLRLNADLQEKSYTGTIVFKDFGVRKELRPFTITPIEFVPDSVGEFTFSCPMKMVKGTLVVENNQK